MNFNKETLALHGAYNFDTQRSISVPIYQNTAYNFENLDQAAARFNLQELGNIYSRLSNPTSDVLGQRLANIEGGALEFLLLAVWQLVLCSYQFSKFGR